MVARTFNLSTSKFSQDYKEKPCLKNKQKSTSVMNYHTNFKVYLIADQTQGLKHEQLVSALSVTALLATILLLKLTN